MYEKEVLGREIGHEGTRMRYAVEAVQDGEVDERKVRGRQESWVGLVERMGD